MKTTIKANDHDALNAAFAKHVADIVVELHDWPAFTRSSDAVLPWLEKHYAEIRTPTRDWDWVVRLVDHYGEASTFPHAAVIALLRAHGVQVED